MRILDNQSEDNKNQNLSGISHPDQIEDIKLSDAVLDAVSGGTGNGWCAACAAANRLLHKNWSCPLKNGGSCPHGYT